MKKGLKQTGGKQHHSRLAVWAVDTLYDVIGGILYSIGLYTFAKSGEFAPGGVSGLALIFNRLWQMPIGISTLIINIPVVILSYKVLGRKFLLKSFQTMLISTLLIDGVFPYTPEYTGSRLLSAVFMGVFMGAGLALIYMRGSSTGGSDFLNVTIRKLCPHFSMGQIVMMTDLVIIGVGGLVYGDIDAVLYGVISTYVTSLVIDKILYGAGSSKLALIITTDGKATADLIDRETKRGATLVKAKGAYSGDERDMVLCACGKTEITKVRVAAYEIDPNAFVMITEASEVFGEGFMPTLDE